MKQNLTLVGEVAEERALGEPDGLGDVACGRVLVSARREQVERGVLQSLRSA
ncbi:hypothetical protein ACXYX3_16060 [Mycobacterium sp. C3-094]